MTRSADFRAEGVLMAHTLEQALDYVSEEDEVMIIGGASFYERSDIKPLIDYLELLEHYSTRDVGNETTIREFAEKSIELFKSKKKNRALVKKISEYHVQTAAALSPAHIIEEITNAALLDSANIEELQSFARGYAHCSVSKFLNEIKLIQVLSHYERSSI